MDWRHPVVSSHNSLSLWAHKPFSVLPVGVSSLQTQGALTLYPKISKVGPPVFTMPTFPEAHSTSGLPSGSIVKLPRSSLSQRLQFSLRNVLCTPIIITRPTPYSNPHGAQSTRSLPIYNRDRCLFGNTWLYYYNCCLFVTQSVYPKSPKSLLSHRGWHLWMTQT